MAIRIKNIRFAENNHAELTNQAIDYSSQLSSFPFTNAINKFRSKVWKPSGYFRVVSTQTNGVNPNNKIYINDGSNKTATVATGEYTTPTLLCTAIASALNAVSSAWTCTYDTAGETYKFTIAHTGSATLRLSQTTDSIASMIGFTSLTDQTGVSFEANEQRNHLYEEVIFDLGYITPITFFALIGPLDEVFSISNSATITLQGNNLNEWNSPPFELVIDHNDKGCMRFLDDQDDTSFRYWRVEIDDKYNSGGPNAISIGHLYLGDYSTVTSRNVASGFSKALSDPSNRSISENGAIYFDRKTKYTVFTGINLDFMSRADKDTIRGIFEILGTTTPFYLSLDPTNAISDSIDEFTKYVIFDREPTYNHVKTDTFSIGMDFREVL